MYIYRGKIDFPTSTKWWLDDEGITVIFPLDFRLGDPVHAVWQWTHQLGNDKVAFLSGTVDSVTIAPNKKTLSFLQGSTYSFEGTFTNNAKSLQMTMSTDHNKELGTATLKLVYEPAVSEGVRSRAVELNSPVEPRVYVGRLNHQYPKAEDELMLIIAPKSTYSVDPICAFWQWTEGPYRRRRVNVDIVNNIYWDNDIEEVGHKFSFHDDIDRTQFRFDLTINENTQQITGDMVGISEPGTARLMLDRHYLQNESQRRKRAIFNSTTSVFNDTDEVVLCSLKSSSSSRTDSVLAAVSLIIGVVGVMASAPFPVAVPAAVGSFLAGVGWYAALGGAVQLFNSSGTETSTVLFPRDTIKRTSSGSILVSDNDIHITVIRAKGRRLTVSSGIKEKMGTNDYVLSKFTPEATGRERPTYEERFHLELPFDMHIMSYRTLFVPGLKPVASTKRLESMTQEDIPSSMVTEPSDGGLPTWYGPLHDHFKGATRSKKMFEYDYRGIAFAFTQASGDVGGNYFSISLVPKDDGTELVVLELHNCRIGGVTGSPLKDLTRQDVDKDIAHAINENGEYWVYEKHPPPDRRVPQRLYGYRAQRTAYVYFSGSWDDSVYFIAKTVVPKMCLVPGAK